MPQTRMLSLTNVPRSIGLPNTVIDAIKPHLFSGTHESRLGKSVGMTQFGVNHVTLDPGAASSLRHLDDRLQPVRK